MTLQSFFVEKLLKNGANWNKFYDILYNVEHRERE